MKNPKDMKLEQKSWNTKLPKFPEQYVEAKHESSKLGLSHFQCLPSFQFTTLNILIFKTKKIANKFFEYINFCYLLTFSDLK